MIYSYIRRIFNDSIHGGVLKSLALVARGLFFFLIVPNLLTGELTIYVFANSTAIIIATILILGLNEELPRLIAGSSGRASKYYFWFYILSLLSILGLGLVIVSPSTFTVCILFSIVVLAGRFLQGIVRSVDAAFQERLQNIPWILFAPLAGIIRPTNAIELIIIMTICMISVQWYCLLLVRGRGGGAGQNKSHHSLRFLIATGLSSGLSRMFAVLCLTGFMRGLVLWPVWLGVGDDLDQIAFAIAIGGIVSQFGLIPANRAYSRWCRVKPKDHSDWKSAIISSVLLSLGLAAIALLFLFLVNYLELLPPQAESLLILAQALIFFSLEPAFQFVRYLSWSRAVLGGVIATVTLIMFILCAVITGFISMDYWFLSVAIVMLAATIFIGLRVKDFFPKASSVL